MGPKYYKKNTRSQIKSSNFSHAKNLIIVESPSKCAKIEHFLGIEYCCIASKGHLRELKGLKSIDTKNTFLPSFNIIDEKKYHIQQMKGFIEKFDSKNIFLATDDDREGEAIAWHICEIFNLPLTSPRIIFHEITKTAIINAIQNPTVINMNLVQAQHARQVLDVIVGYKISPFLWKYLYNNKDNSLSAGRCQTPALRLIYENNESKNEVVDKNYKINGQFGSQNYNFQLTKNIEKENIVQDFLEKSKSFEHKVVIGKVQDTTNGPPQPFCTSKLLQTASNKLHMSPKETMSLCQELYQNGYITYMRTESKKYSQIFIEKVEDYILRNFKSKEYIGNTSNLKNSNSKDPHEAIRVTQLELKTIPDSNKDRLISLYKLIWRNTIESCMSIAKYKNHHILLKAPLKYEYQYIIEIPLFLGWKVLQNKEDITDIQNTYNGVIMYFKNLEKNDHVLNYNKIEANIHVSNKHSFYNEASLVSKLESLEIGRPSTYSTIIETLKDRGYVKKQDYEGLNITFIQYVLEGNKLNSKQITKIFGAEKNKLFIQPIGKLALEFLVENFDNIFSYEYTKNMEKKLDLICNKEIDDWAAICKECYNDLKDLSKNMKNLEKKTYPICENYGFVFEKYGPIIKHTMEDGNIEYLQGNKQIEIDIEKLKNKEYSLDQLLDPGDIYLGKYEEYDMYIKHGRYGYYVEWNEKKESIKDIKTPIQEITIETVSNFLKNKTSNSSAILRELTENANIRTGKFGPYVFYKTNTMKKPQFLNIKKCPFGFLNCEKEKLIEWINKEYKVNI